MNSFERLELLNDAIARTNDALDEFSKDSEQDVATRSALNKAMQHLQAARDEHGALQVNLCGIRLFESDQIERLIPGFFCTTENPDIQSACSHGSQPAKGLFCRHFSIRHECMNTAAHKDLANRVYPTVAVMLNQYPAPVERAAKEG